MNLQIWPIHIFRLDLTRGLLPGDDGERIVQPHALAALFVYEAVKTCV